ncbi:MAG: glucose-6-phosphate isomerase, partial [Desulfobacterales bacterium]|nr:glucose-6-phosphate isomerase [Desulfobacterales bacterium]
MNPSSPVTDLPEWVSLKKHAPVINRENKHLKYLITEKGRLENFSLKGAGLFYDFSRQRVDAQAMTLLLNLAEARKIKKRFKNMTDGKRVNNTEKREALHTASRSFSDDPILVNGKDIMPDIISVRNKIKEFASDIHSGKIKGSTGKAFRHIVVIGIGGSYLGPEFVAA